jgi:carbamoyltransferase
MKDGKIVYVIQEERPTKEKNRHDFPFAAIQLALEKTGLKPNDIDEIGMNGFTIAKPRDRKGILDQYKSFLNPASVLSFKKKLQEIPFVYKQYVQKNQGVRFSNLAKAGFTDKSKVKFVDHHLTHAATAYYGNGNFEDDVLVLTNDGAGDDLCATISIGSKGKLERISAVSHKDSVATLYAYFTFLTGMVPLEHEYKIMGMAPYAGKAGSKKIADELRAMFQFSEDGTTWKFTRGSSVMDAAPLWKEFMFLKRFDYLMGGLQIFIEDFLVDWVKACVKKTGIRKIALAGGTFMNVKANKLIMELPEVESIFVFPSCGDESNPVGTCWHLQSEKYLQQFELNDVYWGIECSNDEVKKSFDNYKFKNKYTLTYFEDIEQKVAELLTQNYVVGRFRGREEFGARSLGNRALIANPTNADVIKEINEMIKSRDFWMPFASSVLDEYYHKYVVDYGKNNPYYMIMTYDTKPEAEKIKAGIHPYDRTVRPQLVTEKHNPSYHRLIKLFSQQTGVGGVLNTSLNLHGLPLVHTPEDAFYLVENSSLKYLAIENYLLEKV